MWWTISKVLFWLFVINLGITVGAGLYEHRIVLPRWIRSSPRDASHWNAEAARQDDVGRKFWAFVTTIPLTLLMFANLAAAWELPPSSGRGWWLAAGFLTFADRLFTFTYFIATMVGLMRAADTPESVKTATRWRRLNYLRVAVAVAAWLAALNAFALLHESPIGSLRIVF